MKLLEFAVYTLECMDQYFTKKSQPKTSAYNYDYESVTYLVLTGAAICVL